MKSSIFGLSLFFLLQALPRLAAQDSCRFLLRLPQQAQFATADKLSNFYLITPGNAVEKYDSTGRQVARYTNNRLGQAAAVDAFNPLRILLWYADFQTLVFLDRTLNEMGQLNLNAVGYPTAQCVANSLDGNIWLYDNASFQLLKISPDGALLAQSEPLNFFTRLQDSGLAPSIRLNAERVLLGLPGTGLFAFDHFAQNTALLRADKQLRGFELAERHLVLPSEQGIHIALLGTFEEKDLPLPPAALSPGALRWFAGRRLFVGDPAGVSVWQF
jgi:hypothetical protein